MTINYLGTYYTAVPPTKPDYAFIKIHQGAWIMTALYILPIWFIGYEGDFSCSFVKSKKLTAIRLIFRVDNIDLQRSSCSKTSMKIII